jgi:hypothetical protein
MYAEERDGKGKKTIYDDVHLERHTREPNREDYLTEKIHATRVKVSNSFGGFKTSIDKVSELWVDVEGAIRDKLLRVSGRGEAFVPNALYILTAALAGNIVTRNRGIFVRWTTPLVFAVATGMVVAPRTTRNLLREVGIGKVVDEVEEKVISGADKTVHGISDGYEGFRRRIRGIVGKTEEAAQQSAHEVAELAKKAAHEAKLDALEAEEKAKQAMPSSAQVTSVVDSAKHVLHNAEEKAMHLIHDAEEKAKKLIQEAERKIHDAMEHDRVKPSEEYEGGADLHTRGSSSYDVEDQSVPVQIKPTESLFSTVQHLIDEVEEKVQHAFEHDKVKPSAEFESGAELHTRGRDSYDTEDQSVPVNIKPTESLLDAAKHVIDTVEEKLHHAFEHDKVKPSAEFESGAELHTRGRDSYDTEDQSVPVSIKPTESLLDAAKHFIHDVEDKAKEIIHGVEDAVQEALEVHLDPPADKTEEDVHGGHLSHLNDK